MSLNVNKADFDSAPKCRFHEIGATLGVSLPVLSSCRRSTWPTAKLYRLGSTRFCSARLDWDRLVQAQMI